MPKRLSGRTSLGEDPHPSKTIIRFWDNGNPPPALVERMDEWRKLNPRWRYEVYDRTEAADYLGREFGPRLREAFLDIRMPAMQADVFRLGRLFRGAGLWVDVGTVCRAPLRRWLGRRKGVVVFRRPGMEPPNCWNGLIYVRRPGHPLFQALWESVQRRLLAREGTDIWLEFGPGHLRDTLLSSGWLERVRVIQLGDLNGMVEVGSSIHFLPVETHWSIRCRDGQSLYLSQPARVEPLA